MRQSPLRYLFPLFFLFISPILCAQAPSAGEAVQVSLPSLTVSAIFDQRSVPVSAPNTLVIKVINAQSSDVLGVSFSMNYPTGLLNGSSAAVPIAGAGCTGMLIATPNTNSVSFTNGTIPANIACTYSVRLYATSVGDFVVDTGPIAKTPGTDSAGATANLTVAPSIQPSLDGIRDALLVANINLAKGYFKLATREKYGAILPNVVARASTLFGSMSAPQPSASGEDFIEFAVSRSINGQNHIFFIYFVLDEDGIWRIESM